MAMRKALAVLITGLVLLGGIADAHSRSFASRIRHTTTVTDGDDVEFLGGVVRSRKDRCIRNRLVVVRYREDGDDEVYGTDFTDANGNWAIEEDGPTGEIYRFTVRAKFVGRAGHRHLCEAATDGTLIL